MKKAAFTSLLYFLVVSFSSKSFDEIKKEIYLYQEKFKDSTDPQEKTQYAYRLAMACYQDQEVDKAFKYYLEALELMPHVSAPKMSEDETFVYEEAFAFYLRKTCQDPTGAAKELLDRFEKQAIEHSDYIRLNFLVATAYANLGRYELFFEKFYTCYPFLADSFLADKIKGILALRLAQHLFGEEKHDYQEKALSYLTSALTKNPKDASLYKILVFLAKEEKNDVLVNTCLHEMILHRVPIARGDVYLYVREAVSLGEMELAQTIIDQANNLYNFSRAISAAQEFLNQHRR